MDITRRLELIAARELRINHQRATPHYAAAAAFTAAATMARGCAVVARAAGPLEGMLRGALGGIECDASVKALAHFADALVMLSDRPCDVARWLVRTRGEVLPLP